MYKGIFAVEHGSGTSAKEWVSIIMKKSVPGITAKVTTSAYEHHTGVIVTCKNKACIQYVIKALRTIGVTWVDPSDFKLVNEGRIKLSSLIKEGFQGDNDNANDGMSGFRGNGSTKKYSELQLSGLMMKLANWLHKNKNASGTDILSKINDLIGSIK